MTRILFRFALLLLLCLQTTDSKAQCCLYTLSMHDTYGDGWNGATLQVLVNNLPVGTFSGAGSSNTVDFSVCDGDSLALVYASGMYENENSYELRDASWNTVFQDGPDPSTGYMFVSTGDCNTPLIQGSHPCTAIPIDTGQCLWTSNVGIPGSGLDPNCSIYQGGDIWFAMQVPPSGNVSIETDSGTINDTVLKAWGSGSCTNIYGLGCDDDGGNGYYSFLLLYDLTPGEIIYIQAHGYGGAAGSFQICAKDIGIVSLDSSELPIVMINTLGKTIVGDTKVDCRMDIKYNGPGSITYTSDSANVYSGNIGIEVRGASSAGYPQTPYGFETRDSTGANNNVSILGMPAENDWVLLSNFNDRSLLKNLMSYRLFGQMGNYSVRAQLCEVLIDSAYKGIYVIGEKIKRDANRVDIANLTAADTLGDDLTGGYILQQNYWNENNSFQSNYSPIDHPGLDIHFVYEYPDEFAIQDAQKKYIAAFVDSLETALYSPDFADPVTGYRRYMDMKSFIDYLLINEVARNADGFKKSVFFHKDKYSNGGKLKAGPVWDFDWAWKSLAGVCASYEGYSGAGWAHRNNDCVADNYSTGWYVRLFQDSTFSNEVRCAYEDYRKNIFDTTTIFAYIDSMETLVQNAQTRHFTRWPILGKSGPAPDYGPVAATYHAELDSLKSWISTRIQWLDENIPGLCKTSGATEAQSSDRVYCYPNPTHDHLLIDCTLSSTTNVSIHVYNHAGLEVLSVPQATKAAGKHGLKLETAALPAGMYFLKVEIGTDLVFKKMVKT